MPATLTPLRIAMVIDVWDEVANGAVASTRRFFRAAPRAWPHGDRARGRGGRPGQDHPAAIHDPPRPRDHAEDAVPLRVARSARAHGRLCGARSGPRSDAVLPR